MIQSARKRVVVTGSGVISPLGCSAKQLIEGLRGGRSGIDRLSRLPTGVLPVDHGAEATEFTGAIEDYGPLDKPLQRAIRKGTKLMCREIEMGVAAAQLALNHARLPADQRDPQRVGVIYGCDYIMTLPEEFAEGIHACQDEGGQFQFDQWAARGLPKVNPLWLLKYLPNMPASHIAIYNDLRGPNNSITLREASAGAIIYEAMSTLQRGHADALIVGATGSRLLPFSALHASLQETLASAPPGADRDTLAATSRPFDRRRNGSVLGEGAGAIVLETLEHAQRRGAQPLGELVGAGSGAVGPDQGDDFQRQAITRALRMATRGRELTGLGHIHAQGRATARSDREEALAISRLLADGPRSVPVTTASGHLGNLGAGGGMIAIIASLMSLGGELFATRNCDQPDPECDIDLVSRTGPPAGDSFLSVHVTPQGQASATLFAAAPA